MALCVVLSNVVVLLLFICLLIVSPIDCGCSFGSLFCNAVNCVFSGFTIVSLVKGDLVALLRLTS